MIYDYLYFWWKAKLSEVAEVKNTEPDHGQDNDRDTENQLIQTPAILVSFPGPSNTFDLGSGTQEMEMLVTLRLITFNYRWKDERIRKAGKVNHFDIARKLYKHINKIPYGLLSQIPEFAALAGTPDDQQIISTISRSAVRYDQRFSLYVRSEQTFRMRVTDCTANQAMEKIVGELDINTLDILP